MEPSDHLERGRWAEDLAASFLRARGYRIWIRNYRCAGGELDLVGFSGDLLCFVEVRFRRDRSHGDPMETVGRTKQSRLTLAARDFLSHHPEIDYMRQPMRFDVVSIVGTDPPEIELVLDAFQAKEIW